MINLAAELGWISENLPFIPRAMISGFGEKGARELHCHTRVDEILPVCSMFVLYFLCMVSMSTDCLVT